MHEGVNYHQDMFTFIVFKALFIVWLRWLREDTSNMAVIDVKLVSGYQVDEESLDRVSLHFLTNVEF